MQGAYARPLNSPAAPQAVRGPLLPPATASRRSTRVATVPCLPAEIGVGLTGLGFLFLMLGVLFFFDRGLLAMGNVRRTMPSCRHGPVLQLGCIMEKATSGGTHPASAVRGGVDLTCAPPHQGGPPGLCFPALLTACTLPCCRGRPCCRSCSSRAWPQQSARQQLSASSYGERRWAG